MPILKLFHGTSCASAEDIKKNGFKVPTANVLMPARWWTLATDRASAIDHSNGCLVEISLKVPKAPPRKWPGYPFLWQPHETDWCQDGKPSNWYAVREAIPASAVRRVTRVERPGCKKR